MVVGPMDNAKDALERHRELQNRAASTNARAQLEQEDYERYIQRLAQQGLTPETLPERRVELEDEVIRLTNLLNEELDLMEESVK